MAHPLAAASLFDLSRTVFADLFADTTYAWEIIPNIGEIIATYPKTGLKRLGNAYPAIRTQSKDIFLGKNVKIEPDVYIEGPAILHDNVVIRHGAYVRANVVLAPGAMVGHATEIKNTIMLEDAHAPHFAYVGDSILGQRVNLGAGTKLSNLPISSYKDPETGKRTTIKLTYDGQRLDSGLTKFGAVFGDDVQTGCNTVANPGCVVGARTWVYALTSLANAFYPPDSIVKLRQQLEIVEKRS